MTIQCTIEAVASCGKNSFYARNTVLISVYFKFFIFIARCLVCKVSFLTKNIELQDNWPKLPKLDKSLRLHQWSESTKVTIFRPLTRTSYDICFHQVLRYLIILLYMYYLQINQNSAKQAPRQFHDRKHLLIIFTLNRTSLDQFKI